MQAVINEIFSSLQTQFIDPIGQGMWSLIGPVWVIAMIAAVLGLIFGFFGMKRGAYAGILIGLLVFGFVFFNFGDRIVEGITNNASVAAVSQESAASTSEGSGSNSDSGSGNSSKSSKETLSQIAV